MQENILIFSTICLFIHSTSHVHVASYIMHTFKYHFMLDHVYSEQP